MSSEFSLQEVFREYLETAELLPRPALLIAGLIASGEFSIDRLEELCVTEGLGEPNDTKEILVDFVLVFARKCLEDHRLSQSEMFVLRALIEIFRIEEGEFATLRPYELQAVLEAQVASILGDHYVTNEEEILQADLQRVFGLGYDQYVNFLRPFVRPRLEQLENRRLITEDAAELRLLNSCIANLCSVFLIPQDALKKEVDAAAAADDEYDEMYDQAVAIVTETQQASISMIQRRLRIGHNRAARMIEQMELDGIVGPAEGAKPREVYTRRFE
jgi:hypothetical protein